MKPIEKLMATSDVLNENEAGLLRKTHPESLSIFPHRFTSKLNELVTELYQSNQINTDTSSRISNKSSKEQKILQAIADGIEKEFQTDLLSITRFGTKPIKDNEKKIRSYIEYHLNGSGLSANRIKYWKNVLLQGSILNAITSLDYFAHNV